MKTEREFTAVICDKRTSTVYTEVGSYVSKKEFKEDLTCDGWHQVYAIYNGALTQQEAFNRYYSKKKVEVVDYPPLSDLMPPKYGRLNPSNVY